MPFTIMSPPRWARGELGRVLFLGRDNAPRNKPLKSQKQLALRNILRRRQ